ncbi:unnamed protein product [Linum trigynum]|uniref:Uncharacterized protein n=1 Tax=Linum trigynum TaxID=586398 RepID=A0AAV2GCD8_9ROSI
MERLKRLERPEQKPSNSAATRLNPSSKSPRTTASASQLHQPPPGSDSSFTDLPSYTKVLLTIESIR